MQHVAGGHLFRLLVVHSPLAARVLRQDVVGQRVAKLVKRHAVNHAFASIRHIGRRYLVAFDWYDVELYRMCEPRVSGDEPERFAID